MKLVAAFLVLTLVVSMEFDDVRTFSLAVGALAGYAATVALGLDERLEKAGADAYVRFRAWCRRRRAKRS